MTKTSAMLAGGPSGNGGDVSLSGVLSAMTFALDLTEGALPGHALRSCLLGMRIGEAIGLRSTDLASLYYALQLKDAGCSSNAARMTQIVGGDDRALKAVAKLADWTRPYAPDTRTVVNLWKNVLPQASLPHRVFRLVQIAATQSRNNRLMIELRCERGADIVRKLKLGEDAAETVLRLDEHWDGGGYPGHQCGEEIPLLARIASVAQNLDVFGTEDGETAALEVLRRRSGTWFDPELVRVAERLHSEGCLWTHCRRSDNPEDTRRAVLHLDPGTSAALTAERIDDICAAFASVVDAKSPFTYTHSLGVTEVAVAMAHEMQLMPGRVQLVQRAALLHDLGKLGVPNTILDKHGPMDAAEWSVVRQHPAHSRAILVRVAAFEEIAALAGEHHERLNGSGYPLQLTGEQMSVESRLIAMADAFAAMTEERPYRPARDPRAILQIIARSVPQEMDARCFAALEALVLRHDRQEPWHLQALHKALAKEGGAKLMARPA
jgi:putative nucleotidyltransferase with HDIG domain